MARNESKEEIVRQGVLAGETKILGEQWVFLTGLRTDHSVPLQWLALLVQQFRDANFFHGGCYCSRAQSSSAPRDTGARFLPAVAPQQFHHFHSHFTAENHSRDLQQGAQKCAWLAGHFSEATALWEG